MKSILAFVSLYFAAIVFALFQGCLPSDHVVCKSFKDIGLQPFDMTSMSFKPLKDSDEVFAKKFGFTLHIDLEETLCMKRGSGFINMAYAYKPDYSQNLFIKDSIKSFEIYCTSDFSSQYPAGSALNNLFTIPAFQTFFYGYSQPYAQTVTLDEIPKETNYYRFYVKLVTGDNRILSDSLPVLKIKI